MGKCFLLTIILTSIVFADTIDTSFQTSISQVVKSDSTKPVTKVEITNLPQRDWWDKYNPIIGIIIGAIIGWGLSYISQKRIIKRQLILKKNDNWVNGFRNTIAKLITVFDNYYRRITPREGHNEDLYKKRPDDNELLIYKEEIQYFNNLLMLYLINENLSTKENIVNTIADLTTRLSNEYDLKEVPEMINNCLAMSNEIIKLKEKQK